MYFILISCANGNGEESVRFEDVQYEIESNSIKFDNDYSVEFRLEHIINCYTTEVAIWHLRDSLEFKYDEVVDYLKNKYDFKLNISEELRRNGGLIYYTKDSPEFDFYIQCLCGKSYTIIKL